MARWIIGIDEAGRGPLAGPVAVGLVAFPPTFNWRLLGGIRDSKQLTASAREKWHAHLKVLTKEERIRYIVCFSSARVIDTRGIAPSIRSAIARGLSRLGLDPSECDVLLDGALRAPSRFVRQKTIIGGDASEPAIALASIAAKVGRDRLMKRFAKQFPAYGFEVHKGYGTKAHSEALARLGLSEIHRRSFCKKFV